jgi:Fe-S-cluster containining protein
MREIRNTCLEHGCVKCCLNTEMLLSSSDLVRIRGLGFSEDFFVVKKNGNRQLKNLSGRCVFHNGQRCTIYDYRPEGCRLYPAIFDEDVGETDLDSYCPNHREFQLTRPTKFEPVVRSVLAFEQTKCRTQLSQLSQLRLLYTSHVPRIYCSTRCMRSYVWETGRNSGQRVTQSCIFRKVGLCCIFLGYSFSPS